MLLESPPRYHDGVASMVPDRAVIEVLAGHGGGLGEVLLSKQEVALEPDHGLAAGTVAVARMPRDAPATVERVLAAPGSLTAAMARLVTSFGIDPLESPATRAEADRLLEAPGLDDPALEDLEDLPFVTIDNDDSRDLDQALWIGREGGGHRVLYALADASFYVPVESALFDRALAQGASYYLPGLTVPMLPRVLSEGLVSLNPDVPRRALVMDMELDGEGHCRATTLRRARIRSRRKLSYARVQRFWDDPFGAAFDGAPFEDSLRQLREVGRRLMDLASERHVVRYHRIELEIRTDPSSELGISLATRPRREVDRCNEQISLLCNTEGARLLQRGRGLKHVQPIFRVHPSPSPEALGAFAATVAALVGAHELDPNRWAWRSDEPLASYLDRLPRRGWPRLVEAIERQAILTNVRSTFGADPGAHHGIGAPVYARFSSPMREVVGIFTHKEALEMLGDAAEASPSAEDEALRDRVVEAGNRAKSVQKSLTRAAHLEAMRRLFGQDVKAAMPDRPVHRGTMLGMKPTVVYVRLDDPPLEVKVHLRDLKRATGETWRPDRSGVRLVRRRRLGARRVMLRLGDAVDLQVVAVDAERGRFVFRIAVEG
jgi:ribonuclease R